MRVAFLGLGAIGRPMALRIARAGHQLTVWNRTAKRADDFARAGDIAVAPTPMDAVRDADVIVTCLSTSADVEEVLNDGVFEAITHGTTLIDCTSGDPATSRRIAARLAAWNVAFIDAPVRGGVKGAEEGSLTGRRGGEVDALGRGRFRGPSGSRCSTRTCASRPRSRAMRRSRHHWFSWPRICVHFPTSIWVKKPITWKW